MPQDIYFSDWEQASAPTSSVLKKDKWWVVPFATADRTGKLAGAYYDSQPEDLIVQPGLTGWHRIYVCMMLWEQNAVEIKLSSDTCFHRLEPERNGGWDEYTLEESFWRCADLTGEQIRITRKRYALPCNTILAWLRFEPMSSQEVDAWRAEFSDAACKRLYVANDMASGTTFRYHMNSVQDWHSVLAQYRDSDVAWVGLENIRVCNGGSCPGGDPENMACISPYDRAHQRQKDKFTPEMLQDLVAFGHEMGLKLCGTARIGSWCMGYPYMHMHPDNPFYLEHPQYRCVDRDGQPIERLSYAYEEVQQYMISELLFMAQQGVDAVGPLFNRGQPNVLFEKPVADRFYAEYGEYPYDLPLSDPRLNQLHCSIITEFMQRLRQALDDTFGKGRIQIHATVLTNMEDCRMNALDPEQWCRLGLVDALISYPRSMREVLEGDIWQDAEKKRLALDRYLTYIRTASEDTITDDWFYDYSPPTESPYTGPLFRKPSMAAQLSEQRIREFTDLEKQYGVKIYFNLMPRYLAPEQYREFADRMYAAGAERFALWDGNTRVSKPVMWSMVRRLGHKQLIGSPVSYAGTEYRYFRMLSVAGKNEYRFKSHWGG